MEIPTDVFDNFIGIVEKASRGEYRSRDFEDFMRIQNPTPIRRLATVMEKVCQHFESRESYLKRAVDELRSTRLELEQLNAVLDSKVKERTRALEEANSLLESLSTTDALTGISNRRNFDSLLQQELARTRRYDTRLSCIMFDIDHFKKVNDNYGHLLGDEVLKMIGEVLRNELRSHDIYARYGGEEFVVLLPETGIEAARKVAEKLRNAIASQTVRHNKHSVNVTVSLGVAEYNPEKMTAATEMVEAADKALYEAKDAGRNRTKLFNATDR